MIFNPIRQCETCGTLLESKVRFCETCGNPVSQNSPPPTPEQHSHSSKSKATFSMFGIGSVLGLVFFCCLTAVGTAILIYPRYIKPYLASQSASAPDLYSDNQPLTAQTSAPQPEQQSPKDTPLQPDEENTQVSDVDGMVMVLIPEGEFLMGSTDQDIDKVLEGCSDCRREWYANEQPQHTVFLDAYWIDMTKVTNSMYKECEKAGNCSPPSTFLRDGEDKMGLEHLDQLLYANHPVSMVSWNQAAAYCAWAGRRLPTEAEWEKAARGEDGRVYPWGNQLPSPDLLNFNNSDTTAVGAFLAGASPYGLMDMAGNITEWVADWYAEDYYQNSPSNNPQGPSDTGWRVIRGSSFYYSNNPTISQRDANLPGDGENTDNGFRCAMTP